MIVVMICVVVLNETLIVIMIAMVTEKVFIDGNILLIVTAKLLSETYPFPGVKLFKLFDVWQGISVIMAEAIDVIFILTKVIVLILCACHEHFRQNVH